MHNAIRKDFGKFWLRTLRRQLELAIPAYILYMISPINWLIGEIIL